MRGEELLAGLVLKSRATDGAPASNLRRELLATARIIIPIRPQGSKYKFWPLGNSKSG
ncbi:MAG TPA: hypothetical protein GXX50_12760 [Firmicutes bacterium]|uniref:hypothetical protein n=1 Tax=Gelria sp. Kuro-4 TaxID=2796927 RepID=UPI0019C57A0D|nr:hypothetical protein [Gelria sp. Kuro-4]BCV23494.1 hypothetical protein kuro4_02670 [Gelria sp. Kuro-4]HHV58609.1 hypothetical protein [Bacillota bacterium]